jgi:hypothetical protein
MMDVQSLHLDATELKRLGIITFQAWKNTSFYKDQKPMIDSTKHQRGCDID